MGCSELSQAYAGFVQRQSQADGVDVLEFQRLAGGAIQNNYALVIDLDGGQHPGRLDLVVRSDAPSRIAASLDRAQEFAVLKVAHNAGVTVPKPLWLCQDESVAGGVFCVMERVPGSAAPHHLLHGAISEENAQALTQRLGIELARLHRVTPPLSELDFLPVPPCDPALYRINGYRKALAHIPEPHPVLEWSLNWLQDHAPADYRLALCHADFRTGNYLTHNARLTAVLDWEFAAWSDPYEDLGWLCAKSWRFGVNDRPVGGVGSKADLFQGYASLAGHAVDAGKVLYWEVMAMTRWAIIALQQAQRHLSKEQVSLELALTGRMLPEIEFDLLTQIDEMGKCNG